MTGTEQRGLKFTPHAIADVLIPPVDLATQVRWLQRSGGQDELMRHWEQHEGLIRDALADPLHQGFELPFWPDVRAMVEAKDETYVLGGNGTGKTEIGGKMTVERLIEEKQRKGLCIAQNEDVSKQLQQAAIYKYSPSAAREFNERAGSRKRGTVVKFNYSQAGGFTENTFVYPNGSQCWFKTVEQYLKDPNSFEGPEYDWIWADEPIPLGLRETLTFRAGKRAGKFLFTFTAIHGYDQICAAALDGAKVVRSLPFNWMWDVTEATVRRQAGTKERPGRPDVRMVIPELKLADVQVKGLPPGHMPYLMQPINQQHGAIFIWTHWNPFGKRSKINPHVPALFDKCVRKPRHTVRTRLFGWTEKLAGTQFPSLNPNVHVIAHARIWELLKPGARVERGRQLTPAEEPWIARGKARATSGRVNGVTSYHSLDPATARSYYLLWMLVDQAGRKYVFDESPNAEEGEWVGEDGKAGDGQFVYAGRGVNFYKGHIRGREREHGLEALRRFGDPRAFATEAAQKDGAKDLFDLFGEGPPEGQEDELELAPLYYEAAAVKASLIAEAKSGSLEKINAALAYDADREVVIGENEPMLYISDRCQNLIRCLLNWNPDQGDKSPWKDPVDALRYLFGEELYYTDPSIVQVRRGKGWAVR